MYFSAVNINFKTTEDMNNLWESSKGKTKLKFYQISNNYYDQMNYLSHSNTLMFEVDPLIKVFKVQLL